MWRHLIEVLKDTDPTKSMEGEFMRMLSIAQEMSHIVHSCILEQPPSAEDQQQIRQLDVQINQLERSIRKRVITHLSLQGSQVSYCLLLMSIVKDAERVGDYLKNIAEVGELGGQPIPKGNLERTLRAIVELAVEMLEATPDIIAQDDAERATEYIKRGRQAGTQCDTLLQELAASTLTPAQVASMVLLTRFHKRIGAHLMNIISSVVMPLHKVDFYDARDAIHNVQ